MADVHPIRLRGPWQYAVLKQYAKSAENSPVGEPKELPSPGKLQMPADWADQLGSDFRGCVRFVRSFGCPTALEPHETVYLVLEAVDACGRIVLNGDELGTMALTTGPAKFDVTGRLNERNELVVEVELPCYASLAEEVLQRQERVGAAGGLIGEVRLEIWSGKS